MKLLSADIVDVFKCVIERRIKDYTVKIRQFKAKGDFMRNF